MRTIRERVRALGLATVAAAVCCGLALGDTPKVGAISPNAGFGHAASSTLQIDPRTAGLSYAFTFGATIADHTNNVARGQAQTANAGLIGTALAAPACDGGPGYITPDQLPRPVRVDSRDPGADTGKVEKSGATSQSAMATNRPFARGTTEMAPLDIEGAVTMLGARDESTSGVDESGHTLATATADIAGISLAGGLVVLEGLHWRSASRPDGSEKSSTFRIDNVTLAGQRAQAPTYRTRSTSSMSSWCRSG